MPRRTRASRIPSKQDFQPARPSEDVPWATSETPRVWCPVCGMCANQSRLDNQAYEVRVAMQRFGGRDNIRYFPEFPGDRENLIEMLRLFEAHLPVALASVQRQLAELLRSAPRSPADGYLAAPDREDVSLPGFLPLWDDEAGEEYALPEDEAEEPLYLPAPRRRRAKATQQKAALPPKPTRKALPSPKRDDERVEEYALPEDEAEEPLYLPATKHRRAKATKNTVPKGIETALPAKPRQERLDAPRESVPSKALPGKKILGLPPGRQEE